MVTVEFPGRLTGEPGVEPFTGVPARAEECHAHPRRFRRKQRVLPGSSSTWPPAMTPPARRAQIKGGCRAHALKNRKADAPAESRRTVLCHVPRGVGP